MRLFLLLFGCLFFLLLGLGCSPRLTTGGSGSADYDGADRYLTELAADEVFVRGNYQQLISRRGDRYVRRTYFPDTKTLIGYEEFTDRQLTQREGKVRLYYDDGTLREEQEWSGNRKTGVWSTYHANGELASTGAYGAEAEKTGVWRSFNDEGETEREENYELGVLDGAYRMRVNDSTEVRMTYRAGEVGAFNVTVNGRPMAREEALGRYHPDSAQLQMPLFPGCPTGGAFEERKRCADRKMLEFVYGNIQYPRTARERGIQGMAVIRFVVEKDGRVTEPFVIRGLDRSITAEIGRIVGLMPRWEPGLAYGEPVRVEFKLPVKFKLE